MLSTEVVPSPDQQRVHAERGDHAEVVEDGREHRRGEPALRLQQAGRDRADAVEHDLRHEPPEEERAQLDLRLLVGASDADR